MSLLTLHFGHLNIPLALHKCIDPTICLECLGISLDSSKLEARLPRDKVKRILKFIEGLLDNWFTLLVGRWGTIIHSMPHFPVI